MKLSDTFERVEKVFFLYRTGQVSKQELDWLQSFPNLTLYGLKDLHAKIYINQSSAIISSMNLYEYSQINNHEIGIKISSSDRDFEDLLKEIRIMIQSEHDATDFKNLKLITSDYLMGTLSANLTYHFKIIKPENIWLSQHEWLSQKAIQVLNKAPINDEKELAEYAAENPVAVDHVHFSDHSTLREDVETQRKLYTNLKTEFLRFLTETCNIF